MPKDKRTNMDKSLEDDLTAPATPRQKKSDGDTIAVTIAKKKSNDDTPSLRRSTSATSASAAKAVSKAGSMAPPPPRTPSRTSGKSRPVDDTTIRVDSPKARAKAQMDEVDKKLEEEILDVLALPASPPQPIVIEEEVNVPTIDAADPVEEFDWADLEHRYVAKMQELEVQEHAVYEDLARLNHMFQIWAEAGQNKEAERSTKRLRTRMAYVQNEEQQLHEKREHYLHVVNAFQSALSLLDRN